MRSPTRSPSASPPPQRSRLRGLDLPQLVSKRGLRGACTAVEARAALSASTI
jgi:hypothetical protein